MLFPLINRKKNFSSLCNQEIVDLEPVTGSDADLVRGLVEEHQQLTGSSVAERLLEDWNYSVKLFVKVWLVENFRYKHEDDSRGQGLAEIFSRILKIRIPRKAFFTRKV